MFLILVAEIARFWNSLRAGAARAAKGLNPAAREPIQFYRQPAQIDGFARLASFG